MKNINNASAISKVKKTLATESFHRIFAGSFQLFNQTMANK